MTPVARAFWVTASSQGEIREEPLPEPKTGEIRVDVLFSAVSRGTESLVFEGRVPASEYARMQCPHQVGRFPAPVKYGYASVGRIVKGATSAQGEIVFCLFPHQTAYVVPHGAVVPVPGTVPAERAVLAANMETALNAIWDAAVRPGDRVSVFGGGVVGCLCAYLAGRIPGTEVELVDVSPDRVATARALGVHFAQPEHARTNRDVVIHASGTAAGLRAALSAAAQDSVVVEVSWFGDREIALPLGEAFHSRRLTLRSSQVGTVSPMARQRWTHTERLALAIRLLADPALDALIDSEGSFDALPEAMRRLATSAGKVLCHRVRYG